MTTPDVAALVTELGLEPLEREGGRFVSTHHDDAFSAIYYLLTRGEKSHLHLLPGPELYVFHGGAPLDLLMLHPAGLDEQVMLGPDVAAGQRPQYLVPGGTWQGSTTTGDWTLVGTVMVPPFDEADYVHGTRAELVAGWSRAALRITELTD
ncbi:MAG: cupin domain-containing protein [Actinomycetia bacterium]|nr:cupin domain-containing protein [Actinomycetes bacterium]MCP4085851.1 cupin domain-containing protein [Actinomycetes bacterium]